MKMAVVFFVGATLATLLIGLRFAMTGRRVLARFGLGMLATGVAFGFWTVARIIDPSDPDDLEIWVTIGVLFLFAALVAFLVSWAEELAQPMRNLVLGGGLVYFVALVVVRFIYPSEPFIDPDGVLFFNPHGSVAALEIGAVTGALLPAIFAVCRHFRANEALMAKVAFAALIASGIALIASIDKVLITIASAVLGAVFLALVVTFVMRPPASWLEDAGTAASG